MNGGRALALALLLGGCVPPGPPRVARPVAKAPGDPHIEVDLTALLTDDRPVWERRPVTIHALTDMRGRRYHRVASGETGIAIARAYGIPWRAIVATNALTDPFVIRTGQRLLLPDARAPSAEDRAAAFHIDIDDIATGGTPARAASVPAARPLTFGGRFGWPLAGRVAERFGPVGMGRINHGIEIASPAGSMIRAAAAGTVAFVGNGGAAGYGGVILLRHGDGWISVYGRAAQASVTRGQTVTAGATIGTLGNDPLHFELRQNRAAVDPVKYLPSR